MKKSLIIFLQLFIVLTGIGTAALLLIEPWREGVNAHATSITQIYFDDPFLMIVYVGSIAFFIALYQTIKILNYISRDSAFSSEVAKALKTIKYCALIIIGFVLVEEIYIMFTHGNDDATGGFMMGVFIILGSIVVAAVATIFTRILSSAINLKVENNLTV